LLQGIQGFGEFRANVRIGRQFGDGAPGEFAGLAILFGGQVQTDQRGCFWNVYAAENETLLE